MASRQHSSLSSNQRQILNDARTNMITACNEFLESFCEHGDTQITAEKEEEKNKKEDFLEALITEISNTSGINHDILFEEWHNYPTDVINSLNTICAQRDEDDYDRLYGRYEDQYERYYD